LKFIRIISVAVLIGLCIATLGDSFTATNFLPIFVISTLSAFLGLLIKNIGNSDSASSQVKDLEVFKLLDLNPNAVILLEADAVSGWQNPRIAYINKESSRILGYSKKELISKSLIDFVDGDNFVDKEIVDALLANEKVTSRVFKFQCKDGSDISLVLNMKYFSGSEGSTLKVLLIAEDVIGKKNAERVLWDLSRRLHLMYQSTLAANSAQDSGAVLHSFLVDLCGFYDWKFARAYFVKNGGLDGLQGKPVVYYRSINNEDFAKQLSQLTGGQKSIHQLLQEVIESKEAIIVSDIRKRDFLHLKDEELLGEMGLKSVCAYPVTCEGNIIAIAEIFNDEEIVIDSVNHYVIEQICEHIGQIVVRREAELELLLSRKRVEAAQSVANIVSWDWDLRTNILELSEGSEKIFGFHEKNLQFSVDDFIGDVHPLDREPVLKVLENVLAGEQVDFVEFRFVSESGEERVLSGCGETAQFEEGVPIRLIGIIQDVTERVKVDRAKREFISTVSHELRTPITSIKGSLGLLLGGVMGELNPEMEKMVSIANRNSERLLTLINDILDLEKLEAGDMSFDFRKISVNEFIEESVSVNESYAKERSVSLTFRKLEQDVSVRGDYNRLLQVMANLISNAAKFSPKGSDVEISAVEFGHYVRISVSDEGRGIPASMKETIFDKFTQVDSSDSRKVGGTGLGLSIVKFIVEKHGGSIDYTAREKRGTTFYFELDKWENSSQQDYLGQVQTLYPAYSRVKGAK